MEHNPLIDVVGWLGAVALLAAYALVSAKKLEGNSVRYQVMNLVGGAFLIVNSFYYGAYPSVGVNVIWIVIAVLTLVGSRRARARSQETPEQVPPLYHGDTEHTENR